MRTYCGLLLLAWALWAYQSGDWKSIGTYDSLEACETAEQAIKQRRLDWVERAKTIDPDLAQRLLAAERPRVCAPPDINLDPGFLIGPRENPLADKVTPIR
jgi:hypothetical protein